MTTPEPAEIRAARGHRTQTKAAKMVGATMRTWRRWESGDYPMPAGKWELFRLKAGLIELADSQ